MNKKKTLTKQLLAINIKNYAKYIWVAPETVSRWKETPKKYRKLTQEYLEIEKEKLGELVDMFNW